METLIRTIFPGLIERIELQIRCVRRVKRLKKVKALKSLQLSDNEKKRMSQRFYDSVRFPWDDEAENL